MRACNTCTAAQRTGAAVLCACRCFRACLVCFPPAYACVHACRHAPVGLSRLQQGNPKWRLQGGDCASVLHASQAGWVCAEASVYLCTHSHVRLICCTLLASAPVLALAALTLSGGMPGVLSSSQDLLGWPLGASSGTAAMVCARRAAGHVRQAVCLWVPHCSPSCVCFYCNGAVLKVSACLVRLPCCTCMCHISVCDCLHVLFDAHVIRMQVDVKEKHPKS